ncbi:MAG TPA: hypothetical protein VFY90_15150, partial [Tepidiformaceae bacterium]|nr:hypothetical protein [Tepidiformaceae bacterium]
VSRLIQRADDSPDKPPVSKTLYMGMNPGSKGEAKALKGVLKDKVVAALNDPTLEKTLETEEGIARWLVGELPSLIYRPLQFLFAYSTILQTQPQARDQMAQVIKMFHAAERGDFRLERIVLSGHSNGVELWGDAAKNFDPGKFLLDEDLSRLTAAFPKAAAQVEDVMFSACYTVSSIDIVVRVFPNVRTVWAYAGASPAAGAGAERHISRWERETRGDQTLGAKDGLGKSALWTREAAESSDDGRGFIRNDPAKADMKQLRQSFYGLSLDAKEQIQGQKPINLNILNNAYFYAQMMLAHPELKDQAEREIIQRWVDVLLRLRHYDKICDNFAQTYAAEIKRAYAAIGRPAPAFSRLPRPALADEVRQFEEALNVSPNADAQAFYDSILRPFWKLDTTIVPATWI